MRRLNVEVRGSVREAPALLFLPALLATESRSLRSRLAGVCRAEDAHSTFPPETARNGESRRANSLVEREKRGFGLATFTTEPLVLLTVAGERKSLPPVELRRSRPQSAAVCRRAVVKAAAAGAERLSATSAPQKSPAGKVAVVGEWTSLFEIRKLLFDRL